MKVVICAAGSGSRWNNYLGTRKHLVMIDGERLLDRTVRQLKAHGQDDITIFCNPEHMYSVPGARCVPGAYHTNATTARKLTAHEWATDGPTLLMLADVYYTDATIKTMTTPIEGWHQYGRLSVSAATGKPGAEMFGWQFGPAHHCEFIAAIDQVDTARERGVQTHVDWSTYSQMTGHNISTPANSIKNWGRHVEIPDDGTDDFDFPDDYERFMMHYMGRSCRRVRASDFERPWFPARARELAGAFKYHRKLWEHCAIAQAYRDRIGQGGRCLGFGVGKEPVPAWLAAQGAQVVATDRPDPGVWLERQHARNVEELRCEGICDEVSFRELVKYETADMNLIPERYHRQFDFTWSSSCFEHLGSIEHGLRFFLEQMKCLKPGGIAAHTTEYQFAPTDHCYQSPDLSFFRVQDLIDLTRRIKAQGDRLWPMDLAAGTHPFDTHIDQQPFKIEPHLNLALGPVQFTSVLLIATRGI